VTTPTTAPSSTTGNRLTTSSRMRATASSMPASAPTVTSGAAMTSAIGVVSGSDPAASSAVRSPSVRMSMGSPSRQTTSEPTPASTGWRAAARTVASGDTVSTGDCITSRTAMGVSITTGSGRATYQPAVRADSGPGSRRHTRRPSGPVAHPETSTGSPSSVGGATWST
jgi:hypothetical protein